MVDVVFYFTISSSMIKEKLNGRDEKNDSKQYKWSEKVLVAQSVWLCDRRLCYSAEL